MEFVQLNRICNGGTSMKLKDPESLPFMVQATIALSPDVGCNSKLLKNGSWELEWDKKDGFTPPTNSELQTKADELKVLWNSQKYQRDRQPEYPEIGDQLDALYHAGVFPKEMADKLKAVKDKYPKG